MPFFARIDMKSVFCYFVNRVSLYDYYIIKGLRSMEREIKVADLASIWGVSVNTTWKRIKNEKLLTVQKPVNNREITFVIIDEDVLQKYRDNEVVNNGVREDLLSDDNTNKPSNSEIIEKIMEYSEGVNKHLIELNEVHNQRILSLNEEIMKYKERLPLLEDKASREGLYINEINTLKTDINNVKKDNNKLLKWLITVIILSVFCIAALGVALAFYINKPPQVIETEKVVTVEKPVVMKK